MRSKDTTNLIYSSLRRQIISLDIRPGQLVREQDICDRFEASRTPVHTALERLCDAGLMEFVPYKGVRSTLLRFADIYQWILMRVTLETKVIADFAKQGDAFALERGSHIVRNQEILDAFALERGSHIVRNQEILLSQDTFEASRFYALDSELHQRWFTEMGLPLFWQVIQDSEVYYTRFRMLDIVEIHNFKEILKEHKVLLSLIESQAYTQMEEVVKYHLFGGIRRMQTSLRQELASYFSDAEDIGTYLDKALAVRRPDCLT
jgi:DNA-binding GntR family transcriptional regulator